MSQPATRPAGRPNSNAATIGGLMVVVFVVAIILSLMRMPQNGFTLVAALLVVGFLIPRILIPIEIKRSQWLAVDVCFEPIDERSEGVPPQAIAIYREVAVKMDRHGFRPLGHFRIADSAPNLTAFLGLFENRRARQTARTLATVAESPSNARPRQLATSLVFHTNFTDGTRLMTSNTAVRAVHPRPGTTRQGSMSFPTVRDPVRLYELHEACVGRYAGDGIRAATTITDTLEYLRISRDEETSKLIEAGYYYLDEAKHLYRLTWKGAFLTAWKLQWPIKQIRLMLRRIEIARMLRELNLDLATLERPAPDPAALAQ